MSANAVRAPLAYIPNALTLVRFALVPLFVVLMVEADGGHSIAAAAVFGIAGVTDQVDGWLARRWGVQSEFGKYADPLADRLMIDAAVLLLVLEGRLPWAGLAIVLARDVFLIVGSRAVPGHEFSVNFLGKLATWILYAAIVAVITTHEADRWPIGLFWTGVGVALAAGVLYAAGAWRAITGR